MRNKQNHTWKVAPERFDIIMASGSGGWQVIDMESESRGDRLEWANDHRPDPRVVRLMSQAPAMRDLLERIRDRAYQLDETLGAGGEPGDGEARSGLAGIAIAVDEFFRG